MNWRLLSLEHEPRWGTYEGLRRYDAKLGDLSLLGRARYLGRIRLLLADLRRVDAARLDSPQRLSLRLLRWSLERPLALERDCKPALWQLDHLYGPQVWLAELSQIQPIDGDARARSLEARYRAIPRYLSQLAVNLEQGLAAGWSVPRLIAALVTTQVERLAATKLDISPLLRVAAKLPAGWSANKKARVIRRLRAVVRDTVIPALRRFALFLRKRYLPRARTSVGISALAQGAACYRARLRAKTGSSLTPRQIHRLGLTELSRLHREMRRIALRLTSDWAAGGNKHLLDDPGRARAVDLPAFIRLLRARADMRPKRVVDLLAPARAALDRMRRALPRAFGRIPKTPIVVRPMPAHRAKEAPAAYYFAAPEDRSRPAIFYVNTHNLAARSLYNIEALTFHEALPGHHVQIALAREQPLVPEFRKHEAHTAFTEGWALYAERLADELGLYSSNAARFGYLNYQAWRAARLVVDTGIHALGWSTKRAIAFLAKNTALSAHEATREVDRYICWPGQALAYMLGRMAFDTLRARAQSRLGRAFSLPAFHDEVLRHGSIPLDVLGEQVDAWIARGGSG